MLTPVIGHTLAADPLPGTGLVGTIAAFIIDLDFAFHPKNPYKNESGFAKKLGRVRIVLTQKPH